MKVFDIEDAGSGVTTAVVRDAGRCSTCRECLRIDVFPSLMNPVSRTPLVVLEKAKHSVLFTLETTGQVLAPEVVRLGLTLFAERLRDLAQRVRTTDVNCQ
jgi:hypothetical protein